MLDPKHRYGSNLKYYHKAWEDDDESHDNFYRWLDRGKGKDVSLPECSREQLEKERITYVACPSLKLPEGWTRRLTLNLYVRSPGT